MSAKKKKRSPSFGEIDLMNSASDYYSIVAELLMLSSKARKTVVPAALKNFVRDTTVKMVPLLKRKGELVTIVAFLTLHRRYADCVKSILNKKASEVEQSKIISEMLAIRTKSEWQGVEWEHFDEYDSLVFSSPQKLLLTGADLKDMSHRGRKSPAEFAFEKLKSFVENAPFGSYSHLEKVRASKPWLLISIEEYSRTSACSSIVWRLLNGNVDFEDLSKIARILDKASERAGRCAV